MDAVFIVYFAQMGKDGVAEILEYVETVVRDAESVESSACARVLATTRSSASELLAWRGEHSLQTASRLTGIGANVLGKIEAGKYIPGEALCWRIQQATGISAMSWPKRESKREKAA